MLVLLPMAALAADPGLEAVGEALNGGGRRVVVENAFMRKEHRFELAPSGGFVPNNPFARRYVGGVSVAWHVTEHVAAEGAFQYSPDAGIADLKALSETLLEIAASEGFQQPLDKVTLGAGFGVRYAPLYGKINLVGEKVLNFDAYGFGGVGMLSISEQYARLEGGEVVLDEVSDEVKVTPVLGGGTHFFLTQGVALRLDARMALYVDDVPDYEPGVANPTDGDQRLYNHLTASAGIGFWFPRMTPRVADF
jgi:outer membrane beta-barrel protein